MGIYEMCAEYMDETDHGAIRQWHMIRNGDRTALCGVELAPGAETRSDEGWSHTEEKFCHSCGALYLRQVP